MAWDTFFAEKKSDAEAAGKRTNEQKMAEFCFNLDTAGCTVPSPRRSQRG